MDSCLFSQTQDGFGYCYVCLDYSLKIFFIILFYTLIYIIIIIRIFLINHL